VDSSYLVVSAVSLIRLIFYMECSLRIL